MSASFVIAELASMLRRSIERKFETNPRMTLAVGATAGLVSLVLAWWTVSALFWPSARSAFGSVAGTVTSVTGSPVTNAIVMFVDDAAGVGSSGRTDSRGSYVARGIKPGRYAVAIQPIVNTGAGEITKEAVATARSQFEALVPLKFHETATSGLAVELKRGRNRYDVDLTGSR